MLTELKDLWARLRVHWHAVAVAVLAALPLLISKIEDVDLRPILSALIPDQYVDLVVTLAPFVLAVMKPMIHLEEPEDD